MRKNAGATLLEAFITLSVWACFITFVYLAQDGNGTRRQEQAERVACQVTLDRFEKAMTTYETETGRPCAMVDAQVARELVRAGLLSALPTCSHFQPPVFVYCRDGEGKWTCLHHGRKGAVENRDTSGGSEAAPWFILLGVILSARVGRRSESRVPTVDEFLSRQTRPVRAPQSHPPEERLELAEVAVVTGRCPICAQAVETGIVRCPDCDVPHHAECRQYYGRCGVYGCSGVPQAN
jgi:hypothetical protein